MCPFQSIHPGRTVSRNSGRAGSGRPGPGVPGSPAGLTRHRPQQAGGGAQDRYGAPVAFGDPFGAHRVM
ncbi:hypothetical protein ACFYO2_22965 [Streptomyces sp. NPDC006602]|uniref:hypothetical protein n=1 Tax=Streptomyces sp. NPDC006602 TaxID=3364751 RepID=UPI003695085B